MTWKRVEARRGAWLSLSAFKHLYSLSEALLPASTRHHQRLRLSLWGPGVCWSCPPVDSATSHREWETEPGPPVTHLAAHQPHGLRWFTSVFPASISPKVNWKIERIPHEGCGERCSTVAGTSSAGSNVSCLLPHRKPSSGTTDAHSFHAAPQRPGALGPEPVSPQALSALLSPPWNTVTYACFGRAGRARTHKASFLESSHRVGIGPGSLEPKAQTRLTNPLYVSSQNWRKSSGKERISK